MHLCSSDYNVQLSCNTNMETFQLWLGCPSWLTHLVSTSVQNTKNIIYILNFNTFKLNKLHL